MPYKCRALCGPTLALGCAVIAAWAVLQLAVMGALYHYQSVNLCEDLLIVQDNASEGDTELAVTRASVQSGLSAAERLRRFYATVDRQYEQTATLCWQTMAVFAVVLVIAAIQLRAHRQRATTE